MLNEWAARDLQAKVGDLITLDYRVWEDPGQLNARSATFHLAGIVPIAGMAADRDLAPVFPGPHRLRQRFATGIRLSRSICAGFVRSTKTTGARTARRRKPLFRWRSVSPSGIRGTGR